MKYIMCLLLYGNKLFKKAEPRDCNICRKHHTEECPNSFYCYSTDDKPHFEPK